MNIRSNHVIITQMVPKERSSWIYEPKNTNSRLLRNTAFFAAGCLSLGLCSYLAVHQPQKTQAVMSHLTAGFEYDETLGRLQLVSNMLPESAMVFLNEDNVNIEFQHPVRAQITHDWSLQEPWIEYTGSGEIAACSAGEIMTIVKNHTGTHTVRILHEDGYESVYSGLLDVHSCENDAVTAGQIIGTSSNTTAFELRKDGISVLPTFSDI